MTVDTKEAGLLGAKAVQAKYGNAHYSKMGHAKLGKKSPGSGRRPKETAKG